MKLRITEIPIIFIDIHYIDNIQNEMHNYKASLLKPNELHNRDNEVPFISSLI